VRFLHGVPEADLPALYSGAEIFAFPSRYEGFGLPPLEALACGAPVLCCDTSSLPEVVGTAGVLLPPDDADAWATAMRDVTENRPRRESLSAAGLRQAGNFSWLRAAEQTLAVYRRATGQEEPAAPADMAESSPR